MIAGLPEAEARKGPTSQSPLVGQQTRVLASYYAEKFHGRRMANGKKFDMNKQTVASNTIKLGSKVRIINPENKKSVIATVTDTGGFTELGRQLDVAKIIAQKLGFLNAGLVKLDIIVLSEPNKRTKTTS